MREIRKWWLVIFETLLLGSVVGVICFIAADLCLVYGLGWPG